MSKYKVIKTEFKNGASLVKALLDLGVKFEESANLKQNNVVLKTSWRTFGSSDYDVAIAIQREAAREAGLGFMDGLGFQWNGTGYNLIEDHSSTMVEKMNQLRQRYAVHEVRRQARVKGYGIQEQAQTDGTIRMTLIRR